MPPTKIMSSMYTYGLFPEITVTAIILFNDSKEVDVNKHKRHCCCTFMNFIEKVGPYIHSLATPYIFNSKHCI